MNIFEQATRKALRFDSARGQLLGHVHAVGQVYPGFGQPPAFGPGYAPAFAAVFQRLAVQLRLDGVHHHRRRHVVDPEVVTLAEAQLCHRVACQCLRAGTRDGARGLHPVGPDQQLVRHLLRVAGVLGTARQAGEQHLADSGGAQRQAGSQPGRQRQRLQDRKSVV